MNTKRKIFLAFILNLLFSIFELIGGFLTGSVAIASDAIHDFGDAVGIGVSYCFEKLSDKSPDNKFTYGYARFSVLGGFLVSVILLVSSGLVIYNAIMRIITPTKINYGGMIVFAVVGLIVNLVATYFTHGGKSINQKAVNLHMIEDVLGWLVVLIGAIVMSFTDFLVIDAILSIAVEIFIVINSIKNLIQIADIFLIKVPKSIAMEKIIVDLKDIEGVVDVHHVHVWTIDGQNNCATLHAVTNKFDGKIKTEIKEKLEKYGICHTTVEMETVGENCLGKTCQIKRQAEYCHTHHHHHHHHH